MLYSRPGHGTGSGGIYNSATFLESAFLPFTCIVLYKYPLLLYNIHTTLPYVAFLQSLLCLRSQVCLVARRGAFTPDSLDKRSNDT